METEAERRANRSPRNPQGPDLGNSVAEAGCWSRSGQEKDWVVIMVLAWNFRFPLPQIL